MNRVIGGLLVLGMMLSVRLIGQPTHGITLLTGAGMLLIFSYLAGKVGKFVRLPKITGYLLLGIFVGPSVSGLFTREMVSELHLVNNLAVSLIALTAGAEIQLSWLRARARIILWIMVWQNTVLMVLVASVLFLVRQWLPFMSGEHWHADLIISIVLGAFAVASSPSVVVAMIAETRASGPLSQTVLGVTVLKDVAVIVLFTLAIAVGKALLGGQSIDSSVAWDLFRQISLSVVFGACIGIALAAYIKLIGQEVPLVLIVVCFCMAEMEPLFHVEPLLMGMTAGFFLRNVFPGASELVIHGMEQLSLPVYCLFFGLAGLTLETGALARLGIWALFFVCLRLIGLYLGTRLGAKMGRAEPRVRDHCWLGFVSQAGVTLAMAAIVAKTFPSWGPGVQTLTVTFIAIDQLVGPPLFKRALTKAGETRTAD